MACSETFYIESAQSLIDKVDRYDRIIDALGVRMENVVVGNSDVSEYLIDDGQVKISTTYRSPMAIADAITKFIALRNSALNNLNGRAAVLRPWRGLL